MFKNGSYLPQLLEVWKPKPLSGKFMSYFATIQRKFGL